MPSVAEGHAARSRPVRAAALATEAATANGVGRANMDGVDLRFSCIGSARSPMAERLHHFGVDSLGTSPGVPSAIDVPLRMGVGLQVEGELRLSSSLDSRQPLTQPLLERVVVAAPNSPGKGRQGA